MSIKYPYTAVVEDPNNELHILPFSAGEFLDEFLENLAEGYAVLMISEDGSLQISKEAVSRAKIF